MPDKIKVLIHAQQRVTYSQVQEMTPEEWAQLKATPERELEDEGGPLSSWLDLRDVADAGNFDDFDMTVVGDDGKPINPRDEYTGD